VVVGRVADEVEHAVTKSSAVMGTIILMIMGFQLAAYGSQRRGAGQQRSPAALDVQRHT
jgi:hypothetical protein